MTTTLRHLKILGKADPACLGDTALVRALLTDLVRLVGMEPLGEPVVHDVPLEVGKLGKKPFEDEGGVTGQLAGCYKVLVGFHTLSTSHVAIHTWPLREEFHLDLYSCRPFEGKKVGEFLIDVLRCHELKPSDLTFACSW